MRVQLLAIEFETRPLTVSTHDGIRTGCPVPVCDSFALPESLEAGELMSVAQEDLHSRTVSLV